MAVKKPDEPRVIAAAKPADGAVAHHKGTTGIVEDPGVNAQQVTQACGAAAAAAQQANTKLSTCVKPEVQRTRAPKARPGTVAFVQDMAVLQLKYGAQLGHLNTNPQVMLGRVATAQAADDAATPLSTLTGNLSDITNSNLALARRDGAAIYHRALAVADAFPEIAKIIAPYREANSRDAKKGVANRKRKAKAAAAAPPASTAEPATRSTTTTVSTTSPA
jgi:hypothetical protein